MSILLLVEGAFAKEGNWFGTAVIARTGHIHSGVTNVNVAVIPGVVPAE